MTDNSLGHIASDRPDDVRCRTSTESQKSAHLFQNFRMSVPLVSKNAPVMGDFAIRGVHQREERQRDV